MKVLYVSKALVVEAYRSKLAELARHVEVRGVMPERWGRSVPEGGDNGGPPLLRWPTLLHGHNHLHLYRRADELFAPPKPDLLHVDEEPYSAVTAQLVRRATRSKVPVVFFAWQNLDKRLPPPFGALQGYVFRRARGAIAGTPSARRVLRGRGYRGPTTVIPQFGVDPERFAPDAPAGLEIRSSLGISADAFVVGFGGRLVPEKGVEVLLDAVTRLSGVHLILVGDGPEQTKLDDRARRAGVRNRTHLVGRRPSVEMPGWLAALDLLVLPSVGRRGWSEQFGRILVEGMACGVPVVASRHGEIPAVVGDAAALVEPGDAGALARRIEGLARVPERRAEMSRRGRARVLARFTHERIARETASFYHEVVG